MSNTYFNISDKLRLYEFDGLLDQYGDAAAAYSLRKLRSGYTGSAIRVRRSSDNTERDMGFYDNELDTVALLDFCGEDNHITYSDPAVNAEAGALLNANLAVNDWGLGEPTLDNKVILDRDAGNALAYFREEYVIPGEEYTISCFVKILDGNPPEFGTNDRQGYLSLGGISFALALDYTVTNIATDIYRISATGNAGTGTQFGFLRWTANSLGQIEVAGMQVTKGNQITDYVPTRAGSSGFGFVHTWYDQSANANHAVQGTATAQPKIVDAGVVVTEGGKPAITMDGVDDRFLLTTGVSSTDFSVLSVLNLDDTFATTFYGGIINQSIGSNEGFIYHLNAGYNWRDGGLYHKLVHPISETGQHLLFLDVNDTIGNGYLNGQSSKTNVSIINGGVSFEQLFGSAFGGYLKANVQELVLYTSYRDSEANDFMFNANTYYDIY